MDREYLKPHFLHQLYNVQWRTNACSDVERREFNDLKRRTHRNKSLLECHVTSCHETSHQVLNCHFVRERTSLYELSRYFLKRRITSWAVKLSYKTSHHLMRRRIIFDFCCDLLRSQWSFHFRNECTFRLVFFACQFCDSIVWNVTAIASKLNKPSIAFRHSCSKTPILQLEQWPPNSASTFKTLQYLDQGHFRRTPHWSTRSIQNPCLTTFHTTLGKKAFIAGIADNQGFGWAIAKALFTAGAEISIGVWVQSSHFSRIE